MDSVIPSISLARISSFRKKAAIAAFAITLVVPKGATNEAGANP